MFIPSKEIVNIGDRVRLKSDQDTLEGVFTKGHEFRVIGFTERGMDLEDDDGHKMLECGLIHDQIEKI